MVKITVDGHCPICQGPTQIEVHHVDAHTSTFTCVKHPQFSHRLTLPAGLPLGYVVVTVHGSAYVTTDDLVYDTPQQAAEVVDNMRAVRPKSWNAKYAVAAVTLLEDPA